MIIIINIVSPIHLGIMESTNCLVCLSIIDSNPYKSIARIRRTSISLPYLPYLLYLFCKVIPHQPQVSPYHHAQIPQDFHHSVGARRDQSMGRSRMVCPSTLTSVMRISVRVVFFTRVFVCCVFLTLESFYVLFGNHLNLPL